MLKLFLWEKHIPNDKRKMFEYAKGLISSKKMSAEEAIVTSFKKYKFFNFLRVSYWALTQNQKMSRLPSHPPKNKKLRDKFLEFYERARKDIREKHEISSSTKRILDECVEMV